MAISGITGTTGSSAANGNKSADLALGDLSNNYETFLKLLTEQLKNQDPLQPQETAEFTNQLVQFSQVEQAIASNKKLDDVIGAINNGQPNQALGYIGTTVEIQSNGISLQEGKAHLTVSTDKIATSSIFEISDAQTGKLIRTINLTKGAGTQDVNWDGKDNNGNPVKDGTYKGSVKALDVEGKDIAATVMSFGKVTGVDLTAGEPYLMLGTLPITMTNVLSIRS